MFTSVMSELSCRSSTHIVINATDELSAVLLCRFPLVYDISGDVEERMAFVLFSLPSPSPYPLLPYSVFLSLPPSQGNEGWLTFIPDQHWRECTVGECGWSEEDLKGPNILTCPSGDKHSEKGMWVWEGMITALLEFDISKPTWITSGEAWWKS